MTRALQPDCSPSTRALYSAGAPAWAIAGNLTCFVVAIGLTAAFWARWQAKLESDNTMGGRSPWLKKILDTHWIRVVLVNASAGFSLVLVIAA